MASSSARMPSSSGNACSVTPLASFLRPHEAPEQGEDEVRLISAEGRLAEELNRFPVLAVPGTESALVLRRLKSWTEEDDASSTERERLAVLELSQAAANLREVQELVCAHVARGQEQLDQVEQNVADARAQTSAAVVVLAGVGGSSTGVLDWLAPSVGVVILGGGAVAMSAGVAAGCAACVVVRGVLTVGALGMHSLGTKGIKKWQRQALESMTEQLPRAFDPLPATEAEMLACAGAEAQRRLVTKLADRASWQPFHFSLKGLQAGLQPRCRPSDVRPGGHASAVSFSAGLGARRAFRVLQQVSVAGSLDPGCAVMWSRPLEGAEGTSLRYLIFSNGLCNRDFYCVCRASALASPSDGESAAEGAGERFAFAVASMEAELLANSGLPQRNAEIEHGRIHVSGVTLTDAQGGCTVEVMADVHTAQSTVLPTWVEDREVRLHVLRTAERLARELRAAP